MSNRHGLGSIADESDAVSESSDQVVYVQALKCCMECNSEDPNGREENHGQIT